MATRRKAREVAVQLLFKDDFNGQKSLDSEFIRSRLQNNVGLVEFTLELTQGVRSHRERIDQELEVLLQNWTLERVASADRNILRLAMFELLETDTPPPVIINEAVELAKRFGDRHSHKFVNGVLDRFAKSG